jgi:hypothetical protein
MGKEYRRNRGRKQRYEEWKRRKLAKDKNSISFLVEFQWVIPASGRIL